MRSRWFMIVSAAIIFYAGAYVGMRQARTEVWARDGNAYVIFPNSALYYAFRPLSLIDAALTGMRFHIGPHR